MTNQDIIEVLLELDLTVKIVRDDSTFTTASINENSSVWIANQNKEDDYRIVWLSWASTKNGRNNEVPFKVRNRTEVEILVGMLANPNV